MPLTLTDQHRVRLVRLLAVEAEESAWPDPYTDRAIMAVLNTPAGTVLGPLKNDGDINEEDPTLTDQDRVTLSIDFFGIAD